MQSLLMIQKLKQATLYQQHPLQQSSLDLLQSYGWIC